MVFLCYIWFQEIVLYCIWFTRFSTFYAIFGFAGFSPWLAFASPSHLHCKPSSSFGLLGITFVQSLAVSSSLGVRSDVQQQSSTSTRREKKERCAATVEFLLANEDPKWYWIQLEAKWVFFSLNARRSRAYFLRWNNMSWRTLKSDNETSPDVQIQKVRSLVSLVSWHGSTFVA